MITRWGWVRSTHVQARLRTKSPKRRDLFSKTNNTWFSRLLIRMTTHTHEVTKSAYRRTRSSIDLLKWILIVWTIFIQQNVPSNLYCKCHHKNYNTESGSLYAREPRNVMEKGEFDLEVTSTNLITKWNYQYRESTFAQDYGQKIFREMMSYSLMYHVDMATTVPSLIWYRTKQWIREQGAENILWHIYKEVDETDCSNCRGKSLSPTTNKILSNIFVSKLTPYVDEIIGAHQCGFRRNRTTTD
jgi:hypothetical protein